MTLTNSRNTQTQSQTETKELMAGDSIHYLTSSCYHLFLPRNTNKLMLF
jgi:hypothetical protein